MLSDNFSSENTFQYTPIKKCIRDTSFIETPCIQQNVYYLSDVFLPDIPFIEKRIDVKFIQKN